MLTTLFLRSTYRHSPAGFSKGVECSRLLSSDAAWVWRPDRTSHLRPPMPLKPDELCAEFRAVYHEAKDRGLRVRPDGFVPVGEVVRRMS